MFIISFTLMLCRQQKKFLYEMIIIFKGILTSQTENFTDNVTKWSS